MPTPATSGLPDGAVAVITGASSGIGLAIARALAHRGVTVVLAARSAERLERAAAELPGTAFAVPTDVTDPEQVQRPIDVAIDRYRRLDVLVANAGVYLGGAFVDQDPAALTQLIDTNVTGAVLAVRAALPHMIAAGTGDVIITGSVSGYQAIEWEPVYSASKHALRALAHTVRRQLVGTGVRVGAIAPGVVLNDLWHVTGEQQIAERVDAGTGIRSEDVADAVQFMLDRPRHLTIRDLVLLPTNQEI